MIRTADHLASYITENLATKDSCRIYQDVLDYCWPAWHHSAKACQAEEISAFAQLRGWAVTIHSPGNFGLVADFSRTTNGK